MITRSYRHLALATTLALAGPACGPSTPPLAPTPETHAPPEPPPVAPEPALAPPALSAAALREAVAQAGSGGAAFMALAGHPGIVSVTIAQDGTKSARCTSGLTVNPLEEYWKCDADLLRCTADRPELGAVWRFRAGPDGARLVDGEIVDWAPARPIPEGDDIGAALAGRDELRRARPPRDPRPDLIGGAIDVATLAGDGTPTRRTLCGNDAVALAHELVGRSGWACEGLECRMRDSVADPELHVGAAFGRAGHAPYDRVAVAAAARPAHEADSAAKIKGMLMAAPGTPLRGSRRSHRRARPRRRARRLPPLPHAADPSAAAAALTPTLACFEGKPDVARPR
ncbi:MAG: hypothetical protein U1F43_16190 [Myxococcota bacterium]